jgi:hypothetical protein
MPLRRASIAALRGIVALIPWALLFAYIVANSTIVGESTNWGKVARVSIFGLAPLVLAAGLTAWQPSLRTLWQGWTGVLVSWAVAFCAFFPVGFALGPFI